VADLQKAGDTSAGELPSVARSQPSVPVAQSPTTLFRNRESACERFEQAWKAWRDAPVGAPPRIDDYLDDKAAQNESGSQRELLVELVGIDLEYRWRSLGEGKPLPDESERPGFLPPRARLSDYLAKYPALGPREKLPVDLIAEEYRARQLGGDRPTQDEYLTQYAAWRPTLDELLVETDWELVRLREGTLIRDYRLVRKIGRGGMGTVYQAVHTKLDKVVAVKVLPQERLKDPEAVLRFQREMRAVGNLRHPNIVEALDAGDADGMPYLVMEYVDGCDLGKLLDRIGPLPVAEACEVGALRTGETVCPRDRHGPRQQRRMCAARHSRRRAIGFGRGRDRASDHVRTRPRVGGGMLPDRVRGEGEPEDPLLHQLSPAFLKAFALGVQSHDRIACLAQRLEIRC
jgi:hypothetical protein